MSMPNSSNCNYSPLLLCESSVFKPHWEKFSSLVLLVKMVLRYAMSLHIFFSFMMTCMVMSVQGELTKVPLRPYLRGNPGLFPQAIAPRHDISVVKRVEDCEGQVGCLLKDGAPLSELATIAPSSEFVSIAPLSELISPDRRFPFEALSQKNQACTQNKDGSDTEDDNDDDGDAEDQDDDDDANDEDFSGEEGGDDEEEEGDPEEDPAANGNEGSDDDDEDDEDGDEGGDDDDDDDDGDEEEEEDEEEDEDQPPAKKRK